MRFKHSVRLFACVLMALGLSAWTTMPKTQTMKMDAGLNVAAIDQFINAQMTAQRVPGLALAITQGDRVLYVKGYGTAGGDRPVTPQTQFLIASLSKSFTAVAVMQLVEAGRIELDAPVQRYLPEFTLADPDAVARITIRHLLNQTSGLSDRGYPELQLPQPTTTAACIAGLRSAQLLRRPAQPMPTSTRTTRFWRVWLKQ